MERGGFNFQKKFGQNFLINSSVIKKIASNAGKNVLEIGPGIGALTYEIALVAESVIAVEIDRGFVSILDETLRDFSNVKVINADILQTNIEELAKNYFSGEPITICANLPYNITTPIIMKLIEYRAVIDDIIVMVQSEACDRFCAGPGNDLYGAVSAITSYYAKKDKLFNISAGNFYPRPNVDSSIMRLTPYKTPPFEVLNEDFYLFFIKAAFCQRRKTLCNAVASAAQGVYRNINRISIEEALCENGFDENIRGERLNAADFARIANSLCKKYMF